MTPAGGRRVAGARRRLGHARGSARGPAQDPAAVRLVDLSHPLAPGVPTYPGDPEFRAEAALAVDPDGCNVLALHLGSHTGTHVDAPRHVLARGAGVDELPLGLFTGPAVVVDVTAAGRDEGVGWADVAHRAEEFRPGAVVVLRTGWSRHAGTQEYLHHPWLTRDAARRIVARGVRTLAVDALSPDRTGSGGAADWSVHEVVLGAGGVLAENLTNLAALPSRDPWIAFLPLRLAGGDGSPVRAVAWSRSAGRR